MLKYPCLVLDHDDTAVQSESTVNYPYFCYILDQFRPGETITLQEYINGCYDLGFAQMCRQKYQFTDQELQDEYLGWQGYIRTNIPDPFPGMKEIIHRQRAEGGLICVVSHSSSENITRDYNAHFGLLPDAIYGWDLPEVQRKPSTYPLEHIMQTYHLTPQQLLVVDDLKPAWKMCRDAGVEIAFAAWSKQGNPEIVKEMSQLCDYAFHTTESLEKFLFD